MLLGRYNGRAMYVTKIKSKSISNFRPSCVSYRIHNFFIFSLAKSQIISDNRLIRIGRLLPEPSATGFEI